MRRRFTGMDEEWETVPPAAAKAVPLVPLQRLREPVPAPRAEGWPFDAAEAARRQGPGDHSSRPVDLGGGVRLDLVRIPAGGFLLGSADGEPDEGPVAPVRIERPFWMGRFEVTNGEFALFDPLHDSHVEPMHGYQFGIHGYPVNGPGQSVVRVSWDRAKAFCRWLSERTGGRFDLPTEAQWEYACRAGTDTAFSFGGADADFSAHANLGDVKLRDFALDTYIQVALVVHPNRYDDWIPRDQRFDDGGLVSMDAGSYKPNAWGLHDLHGNAWEWTRSLDRPYPWRDDDGRNDPEAAGRRVVRGGSWYDRPKRCTSSVRLSYPPYQGVFNVGFRVVMVEKP
jgi:formylglycine-generating enzyme required for sulfatase activity